MPRRTRAGSGGQIFHVINRGVRRSVLFAGDREYELFERLLIEARLRVPVAVPVFCLMPTHFHLVAWPDKDGDLSEFMHWLTTVHAQRWHAARGTGGTGSVYQGRFKSFPIQRDRHFINVCRYVERNALRAKLCERAEDWRWSSLWHRCHDCNRFGLDEWPIPPPANWIEEINRVDDPDTEAIRRSVRRGEPYGEAAWTERIAQSLAIEFTMRPRGRPRREKGDGSLFSSS